MSILMWTNELDYTVDTRNRHCFPGHNKRYDIQEVRQRD